MDEDWICAAIDAPETNPGDPAALPRLRAMLASWGPGLRAARPDMQSGDLLAAARPAPGRSGQLLAALDRGQITADPTGYVTLAQVRRRAGRATSARRAPVFAGACTGPGHSPTTASAPGSARTARPTASE